MTKPGMSAKLVFNRIHNAIRALFARNPRITVEVTDATWSCRWKHMTAEDAERITRNVADTIANRSFAQLPCSATVH